MSGEKHILLRIKIYQGLSLKIYLSVLWIRTDLFRIQIGPLVIIPEPDQNQTLSLFKNIFWVST
jgi:hypothetical protein